MSIEHPQGQTKTLPISISVVTVTEIGTETAIFLQNRTVTAVLGGLIAGSVLKGQLYVTPVYFV